MCVVKIIEKECKLQSLLILIEFNKNYVLYKLFWEDFHRKYWKKSYLGITARIKQVHLQLSPLFKSQKVHYKKINKIILIIIIIIITNNRLILEIQFIWVSWPKWLHLDFWPLPPKNHWINFELSWICDKMQKNLFILSIPSWDKTNFRVLWPE